LSCSCEEERKIETNEKKIKEKKIYSSGKNYLLLCASVLPDGPFNLIPDTIKPENIQ